MQEKHDEHVQACMRIFPTWSWIAGILTGAALLVGTLAWAGSERLTKVDSDIETLQTSVKHIDKMDDKLDTLLSRVK